MRLLAVFSLALLVGCSSAETDRSAASPDMWINDGSAVADLEPGVPGDEQGWDEDSYVEYHGTGEMVGELGPVEGIDAALRHGDVWIAGDYFEFYVDQASTGWAMLAGGFHRSQLPEGGSVTFGEGEHWVYGCAGPSDGMMNYDSSADTVTITEVIGQSGTQLLVTARFTDGSVVTVDLAYVPE